MRVQLELVILIWHQILITNLQRNVKQLEGSIENQTLGVTLVKNFMVSIL